VIVPYLIFIVCFLPLLRRPPDWRPDVDEPKPGAYPRQPPVRNSSCLFVKIDGGDDTTLRR
jgi:hypothetical protein